MTKAEITAPTVLFIEKNSLFFVGELTEEIENFGTKFIIVRGKPSPKKDGCEDYEKDKCGGNGNTPFEKRVKNRKPRRKMHCDALWLFAE